MTQQPDRRQIRDSCLLHPLAELDRKGEAVTIKPDIFFGWDEVLASGAQIVRVMPGIM